MPRWGRGGMVGVGKAIWEHEKTQREAARILEAEHGRRHENGERDDLCPLCAPSRCADCRTVGDHQEHVRRLME